ncbi:HAD family hydrolase [Thermohalobacter berrensis]|uniref:HAD family hydrolase n=2 Tax=Thermohalobacter berrensis TaxID=99594 RepID=A0A419T4W8_9FIRM|nr:HAD family hydrolase [Thermohalobacter berrensis]
MWIWEQIDIEFLEKRGIELPDDLQKAVEGMSFTETAIYFKNRFKLKETVEEIKEEWHKMAYDFYKNRVPLKDGAKEFIQYLKSQNIRLGIGTSNSKELATEVLRSHNILHYFNTIRTSCEVKKGKPHPDVFLKVADDLKVVPKNCLVFEDTYAGVLAAKRAGMKVFAVADKLSFPYKDEICSLADKYIKTFKDIA